MSKKSKDYTMINTKTIGNKIAEARKKMSMSQAQLAQHLFISAQAVGKWERGESMPDIVTFNRLTEILGVDLNYFSVSDHSGKSDATMNESSVKQMNDLQLKEQRNVPNWDMSRGNWVDADFSGLKNLHDKFSSANMKKCKFIGSDLSGLLLKGNHVDGCDFSVSKINNSHIQGSHLVNNLFKDCSLKVTDFSGSYIKGCNFIGADFTGVKFKSGAFIQNTIEEAIWTRTSFIDTHIENIVFSGTLERCYFENCSFTRVTFQNATLTDNFFKCKTLKRIKFINSKVDKITYAFLKNGKADLTGITLLAYD